MENIIEMIKTLIEVFSGIFKLIFDNWLLTLMIITPIALGVLRKIINKYKG